MVEIAGAITAVSAAIDLLRKLDSHTDGSEISGVYSSLIESQSAILAAQSELHKRQVEIEGLQAELENVRAFRDEVKEKYRPTTVRADGGGSCYVYVYAGEEEPRHWICAGCFGKDVKSIIQRKGRFGDAGVAWIWACNECGTELPLASGVTP